MTARFQGSDGREATELMGRLDRLFCIVIALPVH